MGILAVGCGGEDESNSTLSPVAAPEATATPQPDDITGLWDFSSVSAPNGGTLGAVSVRDVADNDHCNFASLLVLQFRQDSGPIFQFVQAADAGPPGRFPRGNVKVDTQVPAEAEDTGYSKNGVRLFATPKLDSIWMVFDDHVELWPRKDPAILCA